MSEAPSGEDAFNDWLTMESAISFLDDNAQEEELVVYASTQSIFMHSVLVPTFSLKPPDIDDLMSWRYDPSSSWGLALNFSKPCDAWISPPLAHAGSKTLSRGEQLVFTRSFDGRATNKSYIDILQKFTHVFDLHFIEERNAYCRLDPLGELQDMIRIIEIPGRGEHYRSTFALFTRRLLDDYLALTDSSIVRMFDVTRWRPGAFSGWSSGHKQARQSENNRFYQLHIEPGHASYLRGVQLIESSSTKEVAAGRFWPAPDEERQYASFIAFDWKNHVVSEISCAPGNTANYFTEADLPFELSPAFFKPEVLLKYKADTDRYQLLGRSISCRGAWHLQTYDINDAGQVHTYIVYLRDLPYEEQLYWKSYNETPKSSISARAYANDFQGSWHLEYDPLDSLKDLLGKLNRDQVPWWSLRSNKLLHQVHYPVTSSTDEWANEILNLDQLLVEGFETTWLKKTARSCDRKLDTRLGSLQLLNECLVACGFSEDDATRLMAPFKELHHLRSKLKGHAPGKEAAAIRKQVLKDHRQFRRHFYVLCQRCDESLRDIDEAFRGMA